MSEEPDNDEFRPSRHFHRPPNQLSTPEKCSRRSVAVGKFVGKALRQWQKEARFTEPNDFVFAIRTPTPISLHNAIARHIKPLCRELGLPVVGWHDLRHTYATWGRRVGIKPEAMRDQLGRSSVQVTLDVYVDDRAAAADQIERYATSEVAYWNAIVEPLTQLSASVRG